MDLIDRQGAIAYAISGLTREIDGEKWIRVSEVRESIKTMPSTLPEIIRCRYCKKFSRRWINPDITFCSRTDSEVKEDDFCGRAERRTDG